MDLAVRAALVTFARHTYGGSVDDAYALVEAAVPEPVEDEAGLRAAFDAIVDEASRCAGWLNG
jgi:hypothetical protein